MLGHGIALALLDTDVPADAGEPFSLAIEQRGRTLPATVTKTPFVRAGQFADTDRPPTT
jgi:glycine cleavage system aminomethyltransferase T